MKLAWFSAGITSAVACKLAVEKHDDVQMWYIHIDTHHEDNWRFIADCERWIGQKINIIQHNKFKSQFDVIRNRQYINGPYGAPCTQLLKKEMRYELEKRLSPNAQIFGFEYSTGEINRAIRFKEQWPDTKPIFPLIENRISKEECAGIVIGAGIQLPEMYRIGYNNNNCIGCVKGGKGYWNKIRQDFPDVFDEMSKAEREIGATCLKDSDGRVYLDDLDPNEGRETPPVVADCGIFCQVEFAHLMDSRTEKIMNGEMEICEV